MGLSFLSRNLFVLFYRFPKVIETKEEYQQVLAVVEHFVFKKERSPEELAIYDLAVMLVKNYESQTCPMNDWQTQTPTEMLQYLLQTSGKKQADLVGVIGSSGVVSEVVKGKRTISKSQAKKLGEMFQVSSSLFI